MYHALSQSHQWDLSQGHTECPQYFSHSPHLTHHMKLHNNDNVNKSYGIYTRYFVGGKYKPKKSLFDQFDELGIMLNDLDILFKNHIAVLDIESLVCRIDWPFDNDRLIEKYPFLQNIQNQS